MSQPFAQFHILRTSTQGQEVAPHIKRGIFLLEEVLRGVRVVSGDVVDREAIGKRMRVRHGGSLSLYGALGGVVLVVSTPAKPLATAAGLNVSLRPKKYEGQPKPRSSGHNSKQSWE